MAGPSGRKKVFRLSDVVQPFSEAEIEKLTSKAIRRILHAEKTIAQSGMAHVRDRRAGQSLISHRFNDPSCTKRAPVSEHNHGGVRLSGRSE